MKTLILILISFSCFAQYPQRTSTMTITEKIVHERTKSSHGFAVGNWLTIDGSGVFQKGSDPSTQKFIGIVSSVTTNTFTFVKPGGTANTLSGLSAGQTYFAQTDGTISTTATDMPVGIATSTTTLELLLGTFGTTLPPPTIQATISVADVTSTTITGSGTAGNGDGRIFLASASPISSTPVNNVPYTSDLNFGDGDEIGTGVFVVGFGDITSVLITGLSAGTTYYLVVYEFVQQGNFITYNLTGEFNSTNTTTLTAAAPTTQYEIDSLLVKQDSIFVYGTRGNGSGIICVMASGREVGGPVDASNYTPGAFGVGSQTDTGTGDYVVYEGTSGDFVITGFVRDSLYSYPKVFEHNGSYIYNHTQVVGDTVLRTPWIYDDHFTAFATNYTVNENGTGFDYAVVDDSLHLDGNPTGFQNWIEHDEWDGSLENFRLSFDVLISATIASGEAGIGIGIKNDLTTEDNRAIAGLFVTNPASANVGKVQLYSGNGTVSQTAFVYRTQSSTALATPALGDAYTFDFTRTTQGNDALYVVSITDKSDTTNVANASWIETNRPSSEFFETTTRVYIWMNGGNFKINPFAVNRIGPKTSSGSEPPPVTADVYVNKSGNDANDCTEPTPCLTIARGFEKVAESSPTVLDMVVGSGTYTEGSFLSVPTNLGDMTGAGKDVTIITGSSGLFTAYTPSNSSSNFSLSRYLFNMTSSSSTSISTHIKDMTLDGKWNTGGNASSIKGGIALRFRDGLQMTNVKIQYFNVTGMWLQEVDGLDFVDVDFVDTGAKLNVGSTGQISMYNVDNFSWDGGLISAPSFDRGEGIVVIGGGLPKILGNIDWGNLTFNVNRDNSGSFGHNFNIELIYHTWRGTNRIHDCYFNSNLSLNINAVDTPTPGIIRIDHNIIDLTGADGFALEAQTNDLEFDHNHVINCNGRVVSITNGQNLAGNPSQPVNEFERWTIHHNLIELAAANGQQAVYGSLGWQIDNIFIYNETLHFTTTSGSPYWIFEAPSSGTLSSLTIQNIAVHGVPPSGSTIFDGVGTISGGICRYNKATNFNITAPRTGVTISNSSITGSGNTLGFNLTGDKYPVTSTSYFGWGPSNTALRNAGQSGQDIGCFQD